MVDAADKGRLLAASVTAEARRRPRRFDSRGLHAILAGIRAARDRGSDIVLEAPSPNVRKILEISGAVQLLDVVD